MMWTMTEEEVRKSRERCDTLHNSSDLEDRITGILIDTDFGSTGLHEGTARIKAKALAQLFEVWSKTNAGRP